MTLMLLSLTFVFAFVAIDSRVGPQTSLPVGLGRLVVRLAAVHPTRIDPSSSAESGFFTAQGREAIRGSYIQTGLYITLFTLILVDWAGFIMRRRRSRQSALLAGAGLGLFYITFVWCLATLPEKLGGAETGALMRILREQVVARLLLCGAATLLLAPAEWVEGPAQWARRWRSLAAELWSFAIQVALVQWIYCALFSSLGANPKGIQDGLYEYLHYWFRQQTGDYRIWGTWWYYLPRLLLYELPAIVLIVTLAPGYMMDRLRGRPILRRPGGTHTDYPGASVPEPLMGLAFWLATFLIVAYALLNEKVSWLATYQAWSLNLLAGLLLARAAALQEGGAAPWPARPARRTVALLFCCLILVFQLYQHWIAVYLRPNDPSELISFTSTTQEFASQAQKVRQLALSRQSVGLPPLRIGVEGEAQWPAMWYFRGLEVQWGRADPACEVVIMDDREKVRGFLTHLRPTWQWRSLPLRGWWIWHGNPEGLPGKNSLTANLLAFLTNRTNDHRGSFSPEQEMATRDASTGFAAQVLAYAFARKIWYPTTGPKILMGLLDPGFSGGPGAQITQWLSRASVVVIGDRAGPPGDLHQPRALTDTPDGNLAVVDSGHGRIRVFSRAGKLLNSFGEGILTTAVTGPCGLACDAAGNFFVADTWGHAIRKFSPQGRLLATTSVAREGGRRVGLYGPRAVATGSDGCVYVVDTGNHAIRVYTRELQSLYSWGGKGGDPGRFLEPVGIAVDTAGRILVVDTGNHRLQRFSPQGTFEAQFELPWGPDWPGAAVSNLEPNLKVLANGDWLLSLSLLDGLLLYEPQKARWRWIRFDGDKVREPLGLAELDGSVWVSGRASNNVIRLRLED